MHLLFFDFNSTILAEGEGFEPSVPYWTRRLSRAVHSTTLPPFRPGCVPVNRRGILYEKPSLVKALRAGITPALISLGRSDAIFTHIGLFSESAFFLIMVLNWEGPMP